jgi:hypothetical protein
MCSSQHAHNINTLISKLWVVQKVAPWDERDGEPATTRRQKSASPPRHPAEHEYQSDTLSTKPAREGEKGHLFLRGIRTIRGQDPRRMPRQNAGGVGGRRDTSRRTSPRNQEDGGRGHVWELDRTSLAARFAFSLSGRGAPRISLGTAQPKKRRRKKRWATTAGMERDGAVAAFAPADLMLDSGVWATGGPRSRDRRRPRFVRAVSARPLSCALFTQNLQFFPSLSIISIFRPMYEVININKKITNYTV